jgi:hypothetical protein
MTRVYPANALKEVFLMSGISLKMKSATFLYSLFMLFSCFSNPASALINPEDANEPFPEWMARIYVVDQRDDSLSLFCYGALTDKEWVMSSGGCFFDVYHVLDSAISGEKPVFKLEIGNSDALIDVKDYYFSDDYRLAMFQLDEEAANTPLKISSASASELLNQNVRILGFETSIPAGDAFYNPAGGRNVLCTINGEFLYSDGALCHIYTFPVIAARMQQTRATIIDPASPSAPATILDNLVKARVVPSKIYLDFRQQNSYPCLEDIGLPIIRTTNAGEIELVGIVASTGVIAGVAMCTPSLINEFLAIGYYNDFIEKTMVAADFNNLCPAAPELTVTYTTGNGIRLDWNAVENADGYLLQYTTRVGYDAIQTADMLDNTSISVDINPAFQYTATVMAYNSNCTSQLSEQIAVSIDGD